MLVTIPGPSASRSKMQKKGWKCWAKVVGIIPSMIPILRNTRCHPSRRNDDTNKPPSMAGFYILGSFALGVAVGLVVGSVLAHAGFFR